MKNYIYRVLVSIDQLINVVLFNGHPDKTLSGRTGAAYLKGERWAIYFARPLIDFIMYLPDGKDHCIRSIDYGEYKEEEVVFFKHELSKRGY